MFIPDEPSAIDISKNVISGDELGPFERTVGAAQEDSTSEQHDFTGMSKEEIGTFLRYVKALETGEDIDIIPAERKEEKQPIDPGPMPPAIKSIQTPSVKTSIVENSALQPADSAPKTVSAPAVEEKPKRVSRFRAAREGI